MGRRRIGRERRRCRSPSAGHDPGDVAAALAARGVFVSHGDFYATTVIERLGRAPEGVVRAGCACYTTADEVARLVDGVEGNLRLAVLASLNGPCRSSTGHSSS